MSVFDATGLTLDTFDEIKTKLEVDFKAAFGDNIKLTADSTFGQLIQIIADILSEQNEVIEQVKNAYTTNGASGSALSDLVMLNGITRNNSEYSTAILSCTANVAGATIPAGTLVSDPVTGYQFATDIELIVAGGATEDVSATAVEPGPLVAAIGSLTQIDTPVFGFASVTNAAAANVGSYEETDAALRLRRYLASQATSAANIYAIWKEVADVDTVVRAYVHQNNGADVDSEGVPPQHIWAIVDGGADADIAEALYEHTAAGIGFHGTTTVPHTDPETSVTYDIKFERPTDIPIYIDVQITKTNAYPADGDDQIRQAMEDFFINFELGQDVIQNQLYQAAYTIPGHTVTQIDIGLADPPVASANIPIALNQLAVCDAATVRVNGLL